VSPRTLGAIVGAIVLVLGVLLFGEAAVVSPGPVAPAHDEQLESACRSCHTPFQPVASRCADCHGELSEENPHYEEEPQLRTACVSCHQEHFGSNEILEGKEPVELRANCQSCHTHEEDTLADLETMEFHVRGHLDYAIEEPPGGAGPVWARVGGISLTPWLIGFLLFGGVGYTVLLRRLSSLGEDDLEEVDPDVAPQRLAETPQLTPSLESSISGLYVVGELAGVPLINRAMKSGFDAADFIANRIEADGRAESGDLDDVVDVLIVGAGPAGIGTATRAKSLGLSYILCEKATVAATIQGYPRAKVVQSAPIDIPEYGTFFQEEDETKEGLTRRWQDIVSRTGLVVNEREEVSGIERDKNGIFEVKTENGSVHHARFVVLALGTRGSPRRLGIENETGDRVSYSLIDASEYTEKRILVVGGGNAACEAALALSAPELLNQVTLSHRGTTLKVTAQNSQAVDEARREGQLAVEPDSAATAIGEDFVTLKTPGGLQDVPNDLVFALIGAELPTRFLKAIGLKLVRKGAG